MTTSTMTVSTRQSPPVHPSKHRIPAILAAAWAVAFAAPHVFWATGHFAGLDTALSRQIVDKAGTAMQLSTAAIAVFCLCGAATALATLRTWPAPLLVRRILIGLTVFGAVLLTLRAVDIYVEFNLLFTGVWPLPKSDHGDFVHLSRWFMFGWLPWFIAGAVAWIRLVLAYTRHGRASRDSGAQES